MNRSITLAAVAATAGMFALHGPASAQSTATPAQTAAPSVAEKPDAAWSTSDSTIGDLLDNPATRAVLEKHIPTVVDNPQIDQARGMTLVAIQPYAPTDLPDTVLAKIDADLAKVPAAPSK